MAVVDLALFKKHVRADDFDDDDPYLEHLLDTAVQTVITATRRSERELTEDNGGEFPRPLVHAVLMLAGHWYNQREAVGYTHMQEVPYSMQALIKPYCRLVDDESGTDER